MTNPSPAAIGSRTLLLTLFAMLAFAGNSLLCRLALKQTTIDPASFTAIRLLAGAVVLWLIVRLRGGQQRVGGNWLSALALFAYAAAFSFAYVSLPTGVGALLLFGAVQASMILYGLSTGERLRGQQIAGLGLALLGVLGLILPGLLASQAAAGNGSLGDSLLMLLAGVAWGVYSLRGRGTVDPAATTAGNFLRSVPLAAALLLGYLLLAVSGGLPGTTGLSIDRPGLAYALASGALASGVGYSVWYAALRGLKATQAASVQLSVPAIAALGGIVFLGEPLTLRLLLASLAILGGIALVILVRRR
jgi:drug/metabolite transporter (DMT)-like permease